MTLDEIDAYCKALPGCTVRYPFESNSDLRAWCIGKKMFVWTVTSSSPLIIQMKANPDLVPDLIANYEFITPGYHMNKRHWLSVEVAHCPQDMLKNLMEDAHALVAMSFSKSEKIRLLGDQPSTA